MNQLNRRYAKFSSLSFLLFCLLITLSLPCLPHNDSLQQRLNDIEKLTTTAPHIALKKTQLLYQEYSNRKEVLVWLARLHTQFSNVDESYDFALDAIRYKLNPTEQTYVQIAFSFYYHFQIDKKNALKHVDLAVKAAMLSKNNTVIVEALSFRATIYTSYNMHTQAMNDVSKAYEYLDDINDLTVLSGFYNSLCSIYLLSNQYESAIEAQLKSIGYVQPSNNQQQLSVLYFNLANIYWQVERYSKALNAYKKSFNFSQSSGDQAGIAYAQMGIGKSYLMLENYKETLSYLVAAEVWFDKNKDAINTVEANTYLARTYLKLKHYQEVRRHLDKIATYKHYLEKNDNIVLLRFQSTLAELLFAEGKYYEAYQEQRDYVKLLQTHHQLELKKSIKNTLEKLNNTIVVKENEVLKLENQLKTTALEDKKLHTNVMFFVICCCLIIILFGVLLLRKNYLLSNKLNKLSMTDDLTHLYNRRKIMSILSEQFQQNKEFHTPLYVAIFDLDKFKNINDNYGHNMGDKVLLEAAKCAKRVLANSAADIGRYGGEEFLVVMPIGTYKRNYELLERLRIAVSEIKINELDTPVTISIGLTEIQKSDTHQSEIIQRADNALYQAKKAGRNQLISNKSVK